MINVSPHKLWEFYGTDFATDFEKSPIEGESALNYSIEGKEGIEKVLNFSTYNNYFDLKKNILMFSFVMDFSQQYYKKITCQPVPLASLNRIMQQKQCKTFLFEG